MTAREFAIQRHKAARHFYGKLPYEAHLEPVVTILDDFGYRGLWASAGWCHDTLEDTLTTGDELQQLFGSWVRKCVESNTGIGETRKERNLCIYRRIAVFPEGAIVKIADRISHFESAHAKPRYIQMYLLERQEFHEAVACRAPRAMQQRLEQAYAVRAALV